MSLLESVSSLSPALLWSVAGILLLIVEVLFVAGFFLSDALSAFMLALYLGMGGEPPPPMWQLAIFVVLGIAFIAPVRWVLRRYLDRQPDINQY